jgi:hypothetical protein
MIERALLQEPDPSSYLAVFANAEDGRELYRMDYPRADIDHMLQTQSGEHLQLLISFCCRTGPAAGRPGPVVPPGLDAARRRGLAGPRRTTLRTRARACGLRPPSLFSLLPETEPTPWIPSPAPCATPTSWKRFSKAKSCSTAPAPPRRCTFNETASLVWQLVDGERSVAAISQLLAEAYPEAESADEDVRAVLQQLARLGVLQWP